MNLIKHGDRNRIATRHLKGGHLIRLQNIAVLRKWFIAIITMQVSVIKRLLGNVSDR